MTSLQRVVLGFAIAPALPAQIIVALAILQGSSDGLTFAVSILSLIGYGVSPVFGVPGYLLLKRYGITGLHVYLCCGCLVGFAAGVFIFSPDLVARGRVDLALQLLNNIYRYILFGGLSGLFSGGLFWIIAVRSN
jgi:hypothetical protein